MSFFEKKYKLKNLYVGKVGTQSGLRLSKDNSHVSWGYIACQNKFLVKTDDGFVTALEGKSYPVSNISTCTALKGKDVIVGSTVGLFSEKFPNAYQQSVENKATKLDKIKLKYVEDALNGRVDAKIDTKPVSQDDFEMDM